MSCTTYRLKFPTRFYDRSFFLFFQTNQMDENYRNTNGKWKSIRADAAGNGKKFFLPSWNERWNNLEGIIYNCCLELSKVAMHVLIWFWETFVNLQMLSDEAFVREWITFEQCFPKRVLGLTSGA